MRARLLFKIWVTIVAAVVAGYYAIGTVNVSGLAPYDFSAAAIIKERCPFHLVRPEWVTGTDQGDILFRWATMEIRVRLIVLLGLWILSVSLLGWQYLRRRRYAPPASGIGRS